MNGYLQPYQANGICQNKAEEQARIKSIFDDMMSISNKGKRLMDEPSMQEIVAARMEALNNLDIALHYPLLPEHLKQQRLDEYNARFKSSESIDYYGYGRSGSNRGQLLGD